MVVDQYQHLDEIYIELDREQIRRTKNIRLIPQVRERRGGKRSYAEWAHVIGIFQTLMFIYSRANSAQTIVDLGSGTGILAIAAEPLVCAGGRYVGLDVNPVDIAFCKQHYPSPPFEFHHMPAHNAAYAAAQSGQKHWPVVDNCADLVTALSVWSHLNEADALFYMHDAYRVLRPGGKAIITGFILDETYEASLESRTDEMGTYHSSAKSMWIFDRPAYNSNNWFSTRWAEIPEKAIAFNKVGLERMMRESGLKVLALHPGCWKENPGIFFQDILILQKD